MIGAFDTEVFKHCWVFVFTDLVTGEDTVIVNDAEELRAFYEAHKHYIWVSFNGVNYDDWIIRAILSGVNPYVMSEWIIRYGRKGWEYDKSVIRFPINDFDAHWSVVAPGLKTLEAFMGDDIRETEVPFDLDRPLTEEEIEQTIAYCRNDVAETIKVFCYKKNEFFAQWGLIKEFDLNVSDLSKTKSQLTAKILNCVRVDRNDEWDFELEAPCSLIKKYKYVVDWFKDPKNRNLDASFETEVAGVNVTYAMGGAHGSIDNYFAEGLIVHVDVTSFYPSLMIEYALLSRNSRTPEKFKAIYDKRVALKKAGKKKEQAPLKIVLNSTYGSSGSETNPLFDPRQARRICINGQLFLTLLLEMTEGLAQAFNVNTDGVFFIVDDESKLPEFYAQCKKWEELTRMGLGYDKYKKVAQRDVNNYIMVFENGKLERKGAVVKELSILDNDLKIVNEAVVQWFVNKVPPEKTIYDCHNLIDFQKVYKLSSKYKVAMLGCTFHKEKCKNVWDGNGKVLNDKTHRVFASLGGEGALYKKKDGKNPEKFASCPDNCFIENASIVGKTTDEYPMLDKRWYVDLAYQRIKQFCG